MATISRNTILFILPFIPYPLESGGHQALFNGINVIKDDYNVLVTYSATDNEEYRQNEAAFIKAVPGISVLPLLWPEMRLNLRERAIHKISSIIKRILGIKPPVVTSRVYDGWVANLSPLNAKWGEHLDFIFSKYSIDVVQVEMPWMIGAVFNIPAGVKKVFVHHELAFVRHQLEIENNHSTTAMAYADFTKMIEVNLLNRYDTVITLSQADRQKLIDAGVTVPVHPSFAVIDSVEYQPVRTSDRVLSFVGPQFHDPNYVGVMWFLNNCWNQLKAADDSYRLRIIGRWSVGAIKQIESEFKDVDFLGFVDDLGEAINGTIMIVPITIGSGIRMKILEAASRGVPVVSTSVGAEGLSVEDGVQCFIKDNPEDFIDSILSLRDENLANSMCEAAYKMVNDNYSFAALREDRLAVLKGIFQY